MGTWGNLPWDNDNAADWFDDLFSRTQLAKHVEETLNLDPTKSYEEIRAAACVLLLFGHPYVWPIDRLNRHLTLAAEGLERIAHQAVFAEVPEILKCIQAEIQELRSRITRTESSAPSKLTKKQWWQFWK